MILLALSLHNVGCASTGKDVPVIAGQDIVWLEKGDTLKAPVRGAFLSDSYYKFQFDRCK